MFGQVNFNVYADISYDALKIQKLNWVFIFSMIDDVISGNDVKSIPI